MALVHLKTATQHRRYSVRAFPFQWILPCNLRQGIAFERDMDIRFSRLQDRAAVLARSVVQRATLISESRDITSLQPVLSFG